MNYNELLKNIQELETEELSFEIYQKAKKIVSNITCLYEKDYISQDDKNNLRRKLKKIFKDRLKHLSLPESFYMDDETIKNKVYPFLNDEIIENLIKPVFEANKELKELILFGGAVLEEYTEYSNEKIAVVQNEKKEDKFKEITSYEFLINTHLDKTAQWNEKYEVWHKEYYKNIGVITNIISNAINELVTPLIVKRDIIDGVVIPETYKNNFENITYTGTINYRCYGLKIFLNYNLKQIAKSLYERKPLLIKMIAIVNGEPHYFEINQCFNSYNYCWSGEEKDGHLIRLSDVLNHNKSKTYKR